MIFDIIEPAPISTPVHQDPLPKTRGGSTTVNMLTRVTISKDCHNISFKQTRTFTCLESQVTPL